MRKSEELARRWMPGTRQGPGNRAAWEHPQDLVNLLLEMRGSFTVSLSNGLNEVLSDEPFDRMRDIAWMHDLYEDGKKEDGSKVTAEDLRVEGFGVRVTNGVSMLSQSENEEKVQYLAGLTSKLDEETAIVKCVDRICNLREGKASFKDKRWARYINETQAYILPLLNLIRQPFKDWLKQHLLSAMAARPVVAGL
jgi:(p)ppGpp synthase/HD superfamily hydrolase